jgi:hypothetical protein
MIFSEKPLHAFRIMPQTLARYDIGGATNC